MERGLCRFKSCRACQQVPTPGDNFGSLSSSFRWSRRPRHHDQPPSQARPVMPSGRTHPSSSPVSQSSYACPALIKIRMLATLLRYAGDMGQNDFHSRNVARASDRYFRLSISSYRRVSRSRRSRRKRSLTRRFTWRRTVIHSANELRKRAVMPSEDGWQRPGDTSGRTLVDGGAAIRGAGGRSAGCGHSFPDDVIIAHCPSW